jgi:hypothetical protein
MMEDQKPDIGKGLWQQMQERDRRYDLPKPEPVTWESIMEAIQKMYDEDRKRRRREGPQKITLIADDYSSMSDEAFKAFVNDDRFKFIGGREGCGRMMERCKRLGIV